MFDLGFFELALIFLVALVVLGPEKLPSAARTVGRYVGRARRMLNEVKADIKREVDQEELRKIRAIGDDLKAAQREVSDVGKKMAGAAEGDLTGEIHGSGRQARAPRRSKEIPGAAGEVVAGGTPASAPAPAPAPASAPAGGSGSAADGATGGTPDASTDTPRRTDTAE